MKQYIDLAKKILYNGSYRKDRTGTNTISLFGESLEFDLTRGFPLLTTKKVNFKAVVSELLWFLRGETNIASLGSKIWDEWADENGNLGPIYGYQWRHLSNPFDLDEHSLPKKIDQIRNLIDGLISNPCDRGHIVSAWNVSMLPAMKLRPCHAFFQCYVSNIIVGERGRGNSHRRVDLQLYQRSADLGLGVPFNIASYALLLHLICSSMNKKALIESVEGLYKFEPGKLKITFGDVHIYSNHVNQIMTQITREPRDLPSLILDSNDVENMISIRTIEDTKKVNPDMISLYGYDPHPAIKMEVSV